jgi:two-component system nitrate/nitrite response regulator NarL
LFRAGLVHVLADTPFRVVTSCANLAELPARALGKGQCLLLLGLDTSACSAFSQICNLKTKHRCLRVIMLADRPDPEELLEAIEAGGDCYLLKQETGPKVLLKSLELVMLGGVVIPQGLISLLRNRGGLQLERDQSPDNSAEPRPECARAQFFVDAALVARLSDREQAILSQLMRGLSNKHIARELNVAEATVKVHIKSLLRKTRMKNRTQVAMWGVSQMQEDPTRSDEVAGGVDGVGKLIEAD